jgi:cell division septation protein DedD
LTALAGGVACGADPVLPPDTVLPELTDVGGPEAILLRMPGDGGLATAYRWPALDTSIWTSADELPVVRTVFAFDDGGGLLALQDTAGHAVRLDLRTGRVFTGKEVLTHATSADGWSTFGMVEGRVVRTTPSGLWRGPSRRADTLLATPSGEIVLVRHTDMDSRFVRLRPPNSEVIDSVVLPRVTSVVRNINGDRWYVQTAEGTIAIEARSFARGDAPPEDAPRSLVITPSGDRVVTLSADGLELSIWERYSGKVADKLRLARSASSLRMDPLGRFVLLRDELADSVQVLSIPLAGIVGTLPGEWRDDLPLVAPDGTILLLDGDDVVAREVRTGTERGRVMGGGTDRWMMVRWDGFRPRDSRLDAPVQFAAETPADSAAEAEAIDSLLAASSRSFAPESAATVARVPATAAVITAQDTATVAADDTAAAAAGYTLAFASLLSESRARALAARIRVDGRAPRVVVGSRDGVAIYRVVSGPFPTRDAAEAAGKRSGVSFWVFAGLP